MANIQLRNLTFKGLNNTYYVPEVAEEYNPAATYTAGQYCMYLGVLRRAKADISVAEASRLCSKEIEHNLFNIDLLLEFFSGF